MVKNEAIEEFVQAIQQPQAQSGTTYSAIVARIDDEGVVWVNLAGSNKETPTASVSSEVEKGDSVTVEWRNNKLYIAGNYSNPSAGTMRVTAVEQDASTAKSSAEVAVKEAVRAYEAAEQAVYDAGRAYTAAEAAEAEAGRASEAAGRAEQTANRAETQAERATGYANDALTQLGVVEDVVGVLEWVSEHATYKASTDTEVVAGKMYFTKSGDIYTPVPNPTGNPTTQGYYEIDSIDEAVSNYVSSHLALTNQGLWVINDSNSYKILLASDGMKVYDASGHLVSTFGESITFSGDISQYIGNNNAYIIFNPTNGGSITIGGSNINLGSDKTLTEVLSELNGTLIYDHTYEYVRGSNNKPVSANFTAFLYRGGVDVKSEYQASNFTWYLKKEEKGTGVVTETLIGTGYTCSVNLSNCGYGAEVIGKFTLADNANALTVNRDNLMDANNNNLSVRATGDSVRVRDLSVSSTIFPTDKLMVIGGEDEHLISVDSLQAYLNANLDKQVKFNTTAGWNSQTSLVSQVNTLYVYTDHQTDSQSRPVAGIKVGDGNAYVVDLPFTDAIATEHIADTTRHITASERTFWNNKVRCYYAGTENLIFTTA